MKLRNSETARIEDKSLFENIWRDMSILMILNYIGCLLGSAAITYAVVMGLV